MMYQHCLGVVIDGLSQLITTQSINQSINQSLLFQIYHEAKKFGKVYNIHVVCAYGGGSMWEQCKACEEGAEIIVATPVSWEEDLSGLELIMA